MQWQSVVAVAAVTIVTISSAFADEDDMVGTVNFPVSCADEAQQRFNKAMALLYSFHWSRLEQALTQVLEADPDCAMVSWAKAAAMLDNPLGSAPTARQQAEGAAAIAKAAHRSPKTQRERDYVSALQVFYKDCEKVPYEVRAAAYGDALELLHTCYPDDPEAVVLYGFWLQVIADRNDQTSTRQLHSAAILEKVFA